MSDTIEVTLAYPFEHDGVKHRADSTVRLPLEVGKDLLWKGRARRPEKKAPKKAPRRPANPQTPAALAEDTPAAEANAQKEQ